jgi:hypothetical protein
MACSPGRSAGPTATARPGSASALILVLAGIVLYAFLNARRERLGQIPEPADNRPEDTAAPAPADTQRERAAGKGEM